MVHRLLTFPDQGQNPETQLESMNVSSREDGSPKGIFKGEYLEIAGPGLPKRFPTPF